MADDWSVSNLKEFMLKQLDDIRSENERRFIDQQKAVETAFNAAKEAVIKSEIGVEKRSDAVYVTIAKLQDALAAVMPRVEAEQRFGAMSDKVDELKTSRDTGAGKSTGLDAGWLKMVSAVGLVSTILGIIYLVSRG